MTQEVTAEETFGPMDPDLRLLYDPNQIRNGAMMALQWCVGERAREYLKRYAGSRPPLLLVSVTNEKGKEDRFVFDLLNDQQGMIEFFGPGKHKIKGQICCGRNSTWVKHVAFNRYTRRDYLFPFDHENIMEQELAPSAELEIEVVNGDFFAKELSPWMEWWIDLVLPGTWMDHCQQTRRMWFAFTAQLVLVGVWVSFVTAVRFLTAFFLSFVYLERNVQWGAVFHPFIYRTSEIYKSDERHRIERRFASRVQSRKDLTRRGVSAIYLWPLVPLWHILLLLFLSVGVILADGWSAPFDAVGVLTAYVVALCYLVDVYFIGTFAFMVGAIIWRSFVWLKNTYHETFYSSLAWSVVGLILLSGTATAWWFGPQIMASIKPLSPEQQAIADTVGTAIALTGVLFLILFLTPRKVRARSFSAVTGYLSSGARSFILRLEARHEGKEIAEKKRRDALYDALACEVSPVTGTGLRPLVIKPIAQPKQALRLVLQDSKLKHCRPRALS